MRPVAAITFSLLLLLAGCAGARREPPAGPVEPAAPQPAAAAEVPIGAEEFDRLLVGWRAAQGRAATVTARFVCRETSAMLAAPRATAGTIQVRKPGRYRRTVFDEKTGQPAGLLVLAPPDLWVYLPRLKEAEHYDLARLGDQAGGNPLGALEDFVSFEPERLKARFAIAAFQEPGGLCRLECTPRDGKPIAGVARLRAWLKPGAGFPEKIETVMAGGDSRLEIFSDLKTGEPLAEELFKFTPPAGVKVTEVAK